MKKILSFVLAISMLLSVSFALGVTAEENTDFTNKICTIANENGYLTPSGADKGKALTVGDSEKKWRFKSFLGGSYAFIGEDELAADVNGASVKEGVTIIQWTSTGANNQRWMIEEAEDGYYIKSVFSDLYITETDGVITQEVKSDELNQVWKIKVVGEYQPVVEKMLESEAAKSLTKYRHERLCDFLLSGGEFNLLTYDKVEAMIKERDYFNLSYEEQLAFVEECFSVEPTDLMYGSMATKLQKDVSAKYVGVEEGVWQDWHGIPEEKARRYDVTIKDTETGDTHTFKYYSPYDDDEEYAVTVGEAVACFEMPIVKVLDRFIYTSMNTSSWNGGDNTIWNNTAYRGDVNNMVQMFAHELGHVMDNGRQDDNVWYRAIAQDMVPVTGYGKTNRWEDLAEYSRLYLLARGDKDRTEAIENTYPARAKAYKGLLYAVDSEFYADYKDEYEETLYAVGDFDKSVEVMISSEGKYLKDSAGELIFADMDKVAEDWYTWEVYTRDAGASIIRNKATGKYITFINSRLALGDASEIGLKTVDGGYAVIDAATGFSIDKSLAVNPVGGCVWNVEEVGEIPYSGDYKIKLSVSGEALGFDEENGVILGKEDVWTLKPVDKDYYLIVNKETGKVFDISGGSTLKGASAILYSVTGGANQHFKVVNNANGTYSLEARHSALKLVSSLGGICQGDRETGYVSWILEKAE